MNMQPTLWEILDRIYNKSWYTWYTDRRGFISFSEALDVISNEFPNFGVTKSGNRQVEDFLRDCTWYGNGCRFFGPLSILSRECDWVKLYICCRMWKHFMSIPRTNF